MALFRVETERLILKPHRMSNLRLLHRWENDPELLYYNDDQPEDRSPQGMHTTRKFLERIMEQRPGETLHYAIHLKPTDRFIGNGMVAMRAHHRTARLGITIGDREQWGQGYAREALEAVLRFCFETLDLNRLGVEIYAFNERSIRLFEGLGFRKEGVVRQNVWKRGAFADEFVYGLLQAEWVSAQRERSAVQDP
jgi:RimJ/RimL family protein N-acetyltransferase